MGQYNDSGVRSFTSGEALEIYQRVKYNSSSEVVYADVDDIGIGVTMDSCTDGNQVPVRLYSKEGTFKVTAAGAFSANDVLYAAESGEVDDATSGGPAIFRALEAATASDDVVEAVYIGAPTAPALLIAAVADSSSITATATETTFDNASKTIDGATLKAGDQLRFRIGIIGSDQNSTDTFIVKLYVGTEAVFTSPTLDVNADADIFYADITVQVRVAGASGTLVASGIYSPFAAAATAPAEAWRLAQVSEDLSGDIAIKATGKWSTTNSGNSAECETFSVTHIPR
ncbi:MAG: DUF2190 family protein [bacterium]|nr:DUF2190 family protein [bacterium]